jgi:hypothetical protein
MTESVDTRGLWARLWTRITVRVAALLLVLGIFVDYVGQQRDFGKWPDLFLPSVALLFVSTGVVLFFFGLGASAGRRGLHKSLMKALLISVPLCSVHAIFYAVLKMSETGADRSGRCSQIIDIANATEVIPESPVFPGRAALGCSNVRHGMFFMPYYIVSVYGVTDRADQERVLQGLSNLSFFGGCISHPRQILRSLHLDSASWQVWPRVGRARATREVASRCIPGLKSLFRNKPPDAYCKAERSKRRWAWF